MYVVCKCKVRHFGQNNLMIKDYTLDSKVLNVVHDEKYLDVVVVVDLKASLQCIQAYSKANRLLGVINLSIVYKTVEISVCSQG